MRSIFLMLIAALLCSTILGAEQTLALIKPDAVAGNHSGEIIAKIEKNGLQVVAIKMVRLNEEKAGAFYAEHQGKPFYPDLVKYISSGPIVAVVLSGDNAIAKYRALMGATDPKNAAPGTIRAEYAQSKSQNAVHGSDSPEAAKREILFFFKPEEIFGPTTEPLRSQRRPSRSAPEELQMASPMLST